jgi:hypothetical protein
MVLPITFATAISALPLTDADIETAISGKLVPTAIKVAPITNLEILK